MASWSPKGFLPVLLLSDIALKSQQNRPACFISRRHCIPTSNLVSCTPIFPCIPTHGMSSTCVLNAARVPILAPIGSDHICPLGSKERWELRARPLGCNVSTLTALSTTVAILSTLALLGIVLLIIWLVKHIRRRMKQTEYERLDESDAPWWRRLTRMDVEPFISFASLFGMGKMQEQQTNRDAMEEDQEDGERRPLLEAR
ncbi:hypothetical protein N7528_001866 [Penicillium herquei]|nr:hypothetical protein N7528_001866 [Penicillium herquei]